PFGRTSTTGWSAKYAPPVLPPPAIPPPLKPLRPTITPERRGLPRSSMVRPGTTSTRTQPTSIVIRLPGAPPGPKSRLAPSSCIFPLSGRMSTPSSPPPPKRSGADATARVPISVAESQLAMRLRLFMAVLECPDLAEEQQGVTPSQPSEEAAVAQEGLLEFARPSERGHRDRLEVLGESIRQAVDGRLGLVEAAELHAVDR